jgi:vacuolar-type H+-ATPase subunit E/Vma4
MAIEEILEALEEQAEAECERLLEDARGHAELIVADAEREAREIRDAAERKAEHAASTRAERLVNAARLEAKLAVSAARGEAVVGVFDEAAQRLGAMRSDPAYDDLFMALAAEALAGIDGKVLLRVAREDESLAESAARFAGVSATVDATLPTAGGLVVEANASRYVRRNTLEDRLERVRERLFSDVARVLFS